MSYIIRWSGHLLDMGKRTHLMGVLNVTPDSFFDGGRYLAWEKAVEHGIKMEGQGADIIDVGGESTRPYSKRISAEEEMDRVIPVIEALSKELRVPISIDSYKSEVVAEALSKGASMINDISALRFDREMASTAAKAGVPVVLMHMAGTPENMQDSPQYDDLVSDIVKFLKERMDFAVSSGIAKEHIVIDPGIGFGKNFDDNLKIIRGLSGFAVLQSPLLVGTSNKAFIGHILDKEPYERDSGTMATVAAAVMNGAHIVRVHNVKKAAETIAVIDSIKAGSVRRRGSSKG